MPTEETRIRTGRLHGGISQQPDHLRYGNQVAEATNVVASVVDGLRRRTGTRFVAGVNDLVADGNYRLHPIDRDESEKYLVVYGESIIRVFDRFGNEATVAVSSEASTYLMANTPSADQLRLRTILDSTFIINTTVPVDTDSTVVDYSITDSWTDYDVLASQLPAADGEYHRALDDGEVRPEGYYQYDVDGENGFATWTRGAVHNAQWDNALGLWSQPSINPLGFRIRFARLAFTGQTGRDYDWQNAAHSNARSVGETGSAMFATYTFESGDELFISGNATIPSGYYPIVSKLDNDFVEIQAVGVSSTVGGNQTETPVTATDADSNDNITVAGITRAYSAVHNFSSSPATSMEDVALKLQDKFRTDAGNDPGGSDIIVQYLATGRFKVVSPWRGTGSSILAFYQATADGATTHLADQSSDPFWFASGTAVAGSGTPTERTQFVDSRWVQVSSPGSATSDIDETTMPVQMVRVSTTPLSFSINAIDWNNRLSGDDDSNPLPELFSENARLADMTLWHDRLFLFGDTYVAASRTGDIFNFYREDATTPADDDPIDLRLSNDRVTEVDFVAQYREAIEVLTKAGQQYRSNNPDIVSPTSIAFTPSTTYNTLSVRPATVSQRLYFYGSGNEGAKVYESFYDDLSVSTEAAEITRHVPTMLPGAMRTITAHTNENMVFALPIDDNDLYVYTSHWSGQKKEQSAWCKWTYDAAYRIADIALLNDDCYMLVDSGSRDMDRYVIERFQVSGGGEDSFSELTATAATIKVGVFASPRVNTTWQWNDGSSTNDVRAYLEGLFTIDWVELPDPITAASLADLQLVILTTNQAASGAAGSTDPLVVSEQEAIRDWIRAGGCYIPVLENPENGSAATTNNALCLQGLTGSDDLAFTFDGVSTGTVTSSTSTFNTSLPIIDGAHGTVTSIGYTNPASIQTADPRASVTGAIAASGLLQAGNLIAYFPRGAYGTTSGAIMLACDSQMFWDADLAGDHLSASSLALLGNFIAANIATSTISETTMTTVDVPVHLDRTFVATGSLNGSDTEWTLPIHDADVDTIILGPDFDEPGTEVTIDSIAGNTVTVEDQDLTDGEVILGRQYTSTIKLTRPYVRDGDGFSLRHMWLQYREVITGHFDTTGYTMKSEMTSRADRTRTFSSATPATGELGSNLNGQAKLCELTIQSVNSKPMTITDVEYKLDATGRDG